MEEKVSQKENVSDIIGELVGKKEWTVLKTVLIDLHPADVAEAVNRMDRDSRKKIFEILEVNRAAETLVELDPDIRQDVIGTLEEPRVVEIIGTLHSDDATDIIGELEEEIAQRILNALRWEDFKEVKTLLQHDEETAGGIMALEIVAVSQKRTAQEAMSVLREKAEEVDDVYNVYVVDDKMVLKGLVSLKDLVLASPSARLMNIMNKEIVSILPDMDQEEVANLFHKYDLVSAPVVDNEGRLVGRITVDDVMDVVTEEASEDITMMAGITTETIRERSVFQLSGVRLPWLLVAFAGEILSAMVMRHFQASLNKIIAAAFFIPLIMAMGGNTGIQSATVVIRGLATGEFSLRDTGGRLLREISVALLNGVVISALLLGVVAIWLNDIQFGLILSISMVAVLFNAALMGTLVPFLLKWIRIDPAIATGPFITTSNDVLGLLVYFGMMSVFRGWFS